MSVIETSSGKINGTTVEGIAAFKAVPYAAPPAGAHRFLPPHAPEPWSGVREATATAGRAPQAGLRAGTRPELETFSGAPDTSPDSEDCLTLHVWTPATDGGKRPVMVWLHGGAFAYGSANAERLRGSRLAKRGDVVVVSVNHRLNIFGHLDLSEVGGPAYAQSGNAGVLDMIAALRWVRTNIARFGGDPANVTICGESGGGGKVSTLLATPSAVGLFHKAIIQSGAAVRLRTKERASRLTACVMKELGVITVEQLQTVPASMLLAAIKPAERALGAPDHRLFDRYPFGPVVDGDVLLRNRSIPRRLSFARDIPLVIGDMKDETPSFLAPDDLVWNRTLTEGQMIDRIHARSLGAHTDRVVETYRRLYPGASSWPTLPISTTTDCNFRIRSLTLAQRRAANATAPVWMYSFEWETPVLDGKMKAPHAMDVPFVFDTIDLTNATGGGETPRQLAATMSGRWATFARDSIPGPDWPAYTVPERATMMFDATCRVERDPRGETRALWQDITGTTK